MNDTEKHCIIPLSRGDRCHQHPIHIRRLIHVSLISILALILCHQMVNATWLRFVVINTLKATRSPLLASVK